MTTPRMYWFYIVSYPSFGFYVPPLWHKTSFLICLPHCLARLPPLMNSHHSTSVTGGYLWRYAGRHEEEAQLYRFPWRNYRGLHVNSGICTFAPVSPPPVSPILSLKNKGRNRQSATHDSHKQKSGKPFTRLWTSFSPLFFRWFPWPKEA